MPAVFHNNEAVVTVSDEWIGKLKREAELSLTGRARLCLHRSHNDVVQEMLIMFHRSSQVRPHRHPGKSESFYMVEGELAVVIFNNEGEIERCIEMGPPRSGKVFAYRMSEQSWHLVAPLTEYAAVHEVAMGPFRPEDTEEATWAPTSGPELSRFIDLTLQRVGLQRFSRI